MVRSICARFNNAMVPHHCFLCQNIKIANPIAGLIDTILDSRFADLIFRLGGIGLLLGQRQFSELFIVDHLFHGHHRNFKSDHFAFRAIGLAMRLCLSIGHIAFYLPQVRT